MSQAWADFLKTVDQRKHDLQLKQQEECFFRGHSNSDWHLHPVLLRHCLLNKLTDALSNKLEHALYFEFRSRARELHGQSLSDWDVLFYMRHHGLATRLLDWTEVLGVAVYFALRDASTSSSPCVWLLNPYALNEHSWKKHDLVAPEYLPQGDYGFSGYLTGDRRFDWDKPVALYPLQRNPRLHAQQGYFTIHGNDTRPLDQIMPDVVKKVALPNEAWEDAKLFLLDAGINEYLLFPDLDGLTRHLHEKYQVKNTPDPPSSTSSSWRPTRRLRRRGLWRR